MQRAAWIAVVVMTAALAWAQQGAVPSSRTDFGTLCGIQDTSPQSAMRFARSTSGQWAPAAPERHSEYGNDMAARAWHEKNWMVDIHDSPTKQPAVIHTGQFCFDAQGRITRMIDRYMELAHCRCMRFTSLTFAPDGAVKKRELDYADALTGERIQEPAAAKGLPEVWPYRRLDQLPFYELLKK
jgi:hypothetical protein